jgi:hypothetical protein
VVAVSLSISKCPLDGESYPTVSLCNEFQPSDFGLVTAGGLECARRRRPLPSARAVFLIFKCLTYRLISRYTLINAAMERRML